MVCQEVVEVRGSGIDGITAACCVYIYISVVIIRYIKYIFLLFIVFFYTAYDYIFI